MIRVAPQQNLNQKVCSINRLKRVKKMKKLEFKNQFAAVVLAGLFLLGLTPHSLAGDGTDISIMVLSDDADPVSLPSNDSVSKMISTKIKEQFHRYHYNVVPKEQLSADPDLGFNLSKRMDTATLLKIAMAAKMSGKAEFDVRGVVIYKVYPQVKDLEFGKQVTIEISGEIHDADSKRFLGDFGPVVKKFPAPANCDDDGVCIHGIARQKAADIAAVVAGEARQKLAILTKSEGSKGSNSGLTNTFNVRFENFTMKNVIKIKNTMERDFPNFVKSGKIQGSDPIIEFGYITRAPQEKVVEWIHILLDDMNLDKSSKILADGNSLVIKNIGSDLPKKERSSNESKFK